MVYFILENILFCSKFSHISSAEFKMIYNTVIYGSDEMLFQMSCCAGCIDFIAAAIKSQYLFLKIRNYRTEKFNLSKKLLIRNHNMKYFWCFYCALLVIIHCKYDLIKEVFVDNMFHNISYFHRNSLVHVCVCVCVCVFISFHRKGFS